MSRSGFFIRLSRCAIASSPFIPSDIEFKYDNLYGFNQKKLSYYQNIKIGIDSDEYLYPSTSSYRNTKLPPDKETSSYSNTKLPPDKETSFDTDTQISPNEGKNHINIDFKSLGIGGLREQITKIINCVLISYLLPKEMIKKYNVEHVKGILLYGPPGTGKTLIARKIAEIIPNVIVEHVNGPELKAPLMGQTESAIRKLFKVASGATKVIIFDEIDSIALKRGITNNHHADSDLIQLLTMMDGLNSSNNVILIGITNRKESLDPAILRSGRLEFHVEINLPDKDGRKEILDIYLDPLRRENLLRDVDSDEWAEKLEGYSGADIKSLVSKAKNLALLRNCQVVSNVIHLDLDQELSKITNDDMITSYNTLKQ